MTTQTTTSPVLSGSALGEKLCAMAGADFVRPAGVDDAVAGVAAGWVVEPGSESEIAAVLRFASEAGLTVIPRGGGTKLVWGNPPERADLILSLRRLNAVLEHTWADMTVTVEAGCTFKALADALAKHGQRLALDPLWPDRTTVGGVLSTNDSGVLRLGYGGLRDLVIGITLALADGTLAKSGGKVVKNVAGYDLPKLATGALGTLGVITQAIFRIHPLPAGTRTLLLRPADISGMRRVILDLLHSDLPCAQIQACLDGNAAPTIHIGLEGSAAGLAAQEAAVSALVKPLALAPETAKVWQARQEFWRPPQSGMHARIAKISVLPAELGELAAALTRRAEGHAHWQAVLQATGIGWVRVEAAESASLATILAGMRTEIERGGGSLAVFPLPVDSIGGEAAGVALDPWGHAGNALPLMAAIKQQFDPRRTLNPGRFVGGI